MNSNNEYLALTDDIYADYGVEGYATPELDDDRSFLGSERIEEEIPCLTFEVNYPAGHSVPHFLGDEVPLVSNVFIDLLKKNGIENFQAFPAIRNNPETGEGWQSYLALNIIGCARAADIEKSEYDPIMEEDDNIPPLLAFERIVLLRKQLDNVLIFGMGESPSSLIIHRKLYPILVDNRP